MLKSQIESFYKKQDNPNRLCQGDIIKNFSFSQSIKKDSLIEIKTITFPYIVILSQDCDLMQFFDNNNKKADGIFNQYLQNVLFAPAFLRADIEKGEHLLLFNIKQTVKTKKEIAKIIDLKEERYHYLQENMNLLLPELFIDFKIYYSMEPHRIFEIYSNNYIATINELFRERLTQRYANYISRIGTPDLNRNIGIDFLLSNQAEN
ncbi:hypothetical protein MASR1M68_14850 [Elusimicrobiota bacterium]